MLTYPEWTRREARRLRIRRAAYLAVLFVMWALAFASVEVAVLCAAGWRP